VIVHLTDSEEYTHINTKEGGDTKQDHAKTPKTKTKKQTKRCAKCRTRYMHLKDSPNHGYVCEDCLFAANRDEKDDCDCDGECGHPGCDCACHGEFEYHCAICDDYPLFKGEWCENDKKNTDKETTGTADA
jgi:hypothetical protein